MNTLRTRAITGVIFGAVVIGAILGGEVSSIILFGIVALFASYELARMLRRDYQDGLMIITFLCGAIPFILSMFYKVPTAQIPILIIITCIILGGFLTAMLLNKGADLLEKLSPLTAFCYLGLSFYVLRLVFLKPPFQWELLLSIILLIWSSDTFAYLIGSQIGKRKLYPKVSPGKSWEGFLGAGICNMLIGYLLYNIFGGYSVTFYISLGILVWFIGSMGDLFESFLKRHFGIKDSGSFLPGHGGFLDRFDSFIFVIPFVCLLMVIFNII